MSHFKHLCSCHDSNVGVLAPHARQRQMQVWECLSVPVCLLRKGRWALTHWIPRCPLRLLPLLRSPPPVPLALFLIPGHKLGVGWHNSLSVPQDTHTQVHSCVCFHKWRIDVQKNSPLACFSFFFFFPGLTSFVKGNYPLKEGYWMLWVKPEDTHTHTPYDANSSRTTNSSAKLFPCPRWENQTDKKRSLLSKPSFILLLSFLLWDGVPKEPSAAAPAALKQTSQQVEPSTNTTLFAEQQWSFVAFLIVDSKLWALCEQEKENRDRNLAGT